MREYAVIGLGQFGARAARTLTELGGLVIGIDSDMNVVEAIKNDIARAVCLDCTSELALRAAGVGQIDTAIVALGGATEASIMATAILHSLGVGRVVARANSPLHERILKVVGAQRVYNPEEQTAIQVARSIISPDVQEVIPLASGHSLVEIVALPVFVGSTLRTLNFRARFGLNIVGIRKRRLSVDDKGESTVSYELNDLPSPDDEIGDGDILLVVGSDVRIHALEAER
jgi:trk system potassium uptake protein TrkA